MSRLFIGKRNASSAFSVKVMKGNNDPLTTPNTVAHAGKFLFNSEFRDQLYVNEIQDIPDYSNTGYGAVYYPGGTGPNSYHRRRQTVDTPFGQKAHQWHYSRRAWDLPWDPIMEFRNRPTLGAYQGGPSSELSLLGESGDGVYWLGIRRGRVGYVSGYSDWGEAYTHMLRSGKGRPAIGGSEGGGYLLSSATPLTIATALELPSTSAALANPSNTPVAGQRNVLMNPNQVVVSRPGFTTASTGRNLILDSGRIPAKIIASGEVRIAAGASVTVASPVTLRPTAYVDYHVKAASVAQWTHPPLQTGSLTSKVTIPFRWRINAGSVQMQNQASFAIDVRYMILADDSQQTSGGSEWMRKIGNEWQIKRPGSSDSNPALSDIMIDTRFSYVPILDEGYIPISQFTEAPTNLAYGQKAQTINFDLPPGMVPFVKFVVRMQYTYEDDFTSPTLMQGYREPVSELFMGQIESQAGGGAYLGRQSSLGTVAHITNGSVKFHVAHTNPYMLNFNSAGDIEAMFGSAERPIGIRYFIYGIPNS